MKRALTILAIALLLFLGFGGIYGGWMLISEPDGSDIGFPIELLDGTPFKSYLFPGIVLLLFLGLLPIFTAIITTLKKNKSAWMITIQGMILIGWLTIELVLNSDFFQPLMHYTSYALGILLTAIGVMLLRMKKK